MKTALCTKLGIELPILQASIGGIASPALAAAVSNAGGLGAIAMTGRGADGVRSTLDDIRARSSQPFAANLLLSFDIDIEFRALLENPPSVISFFGVMSRLTPKLCTMRVRWLWPRSAVSMRRSRR
jgi:NAD(P)H-dependent flavin oxidoreductase YrpB (nitropropane dioxygenase family)